MIEVGKTLNSFVRSKAMQKLQETNGLKTFTYDWGYATLIKARLYKYIWILLAPEIEFSDAKQVKSFASDVKKLGQEQGVTFIRVLPAFTYQVRDNSGEVMGTDTTCTDALVKNGFQHLGYCGERGAERNIAHPLMLFLKDLQGFTTIDELMMDFQPTTRNLMRRAKKLGVKVRQVGEDELDKVAKIIDETGTRRGFRGLTLQHYQNLYKTLGDAVEFIVCEVEIEGNVIPVCAGVFIWNDDELVHLYGGSIHQYMKYNAAYLIHEVMMEKALTAGKRYYNFYGISGKFDGSDGVLKFKQKFHGFIEELPGVFEMPINRLSHLIYKLHTSLRG